jgi:hypothetical protein
MEIVHRRQLLRAIVELKGAPEPRTAATAPIASHDTAERRHVRVMFSDSRLQRRMGLQAAATTSSPALTARSGAYADFDLVRNARFASSAD